PKFFASSLEVGDVTEWPKVLPC
ncbi:MAG: hypothetical protein RLZZ80_88, partial [Pseudomonadota bacterium]